MYQSHHATPETRSRQTRAVTTGNDCGGACERIQFRGGDFVVVAKRMMRRAHERAEAGKIAPSQGCYAQHRALLLMHHVADSTAERMRKTICQTFEFSGQHVAQPGDLRQMLLQQFKRFPQPAR